MTDEVYKPNPLRKALTGLGISRGEKPRSYNLHVTLWREEEIPRHLEPLPASENSATGAWAKDLREVRKTRIATFQNRVQEAGKNAIETLNYADGVITITFKEGVISPLEALLIENCQAREQRL